MEKYAVIEIESGKVVTVALWDGVSLWDLGERFHVEPFDPAIHRIERAAKKLNPI